MHLTTPTDGSVPEEVANFRTVLKLVVGLEFGQAESLILAIHD